MLLADFGTSYSKLLDLHSQESPQILPNRQLDPALRVDLGTGHNAKRRSKRAVNELTALAKGGRRLIHEENFVLLDCGSRDIKFVRLQGAEVVDMGWNVECGASLGFTIELLTQYYSLNPVELPVPKGGFSITCGVLGLSHIFDAVAAGTAETEAVAKFIHGIAQNAHRFAGSPEQLYLSGGLCENPLFVACLPCEVIPLGRFVLLEGLKSYLDRNFS